jgi:hypothetical protein
LGEKKLGIQKEKKMGDIKMGSLDPTGGEKTEKREEKGKKKTAQILLR